MIGEKQQGYKCQLQESDQIPLNIFVKSDQYDQNFPTLTSQPQALHVEERCQCV